MFYVLKLTNSEQLTLNLSIPQPHFEVVISAKIIAIDNTDYKSDHSSIKVTINDQTISNLNQVSSGKVVESIQRYCPQFDNLDKNVDLYFKQPHSQNQMVLKIVSNDVNLIGIYKLTIRVSYCRLNCAQCSNQQLCQKCNQNYYLYKGTCVEICPGGSTIISSSPNTCTLCDSNCMECQTSSTKCTKCYQGTYLKNNTCVTKCTPILEFYDDTLRKCLSINIKDIVTLGCIIGYKSYQKECVSECPIGTYVDGIYCYDCQSKFSNCLQCNFDKCLKCAQNYININGQCKSCPSGCEVCSDEKTCQQCNSSTYKNQSGLCTTTCPAGTFNSNSSQKCEKCVLEANCSQCSDFSNVCTSCSNNTTQKDGLCQPQCDLGFYFDTVLQQCVSCGQGYFYNLTTKYCQSCPGHCLQCNNDNKCIQCEENYFVSDGICAEVPSNIVCPSNCKQCYEDTSLNIVCLECNQNFYLNGYECVSECKYGQQLNGKCFGCYQTECQACSSPDYRSCIACNSGSILKDGVCVQECGNTYVAEINDNSIAPLGQICNKCLDDYDLCQQCLDSKIKSCISCLQGGFLLNQECLLQCPDGYFLDTKNHVCTPCSQTECFQCLKSEQQCDQCNSGLALFENKCYNDCQQGYTKALIDGVLSCVSCKVNNCSFCNKSDVVCDQCISGFSLYKNLCYDICPNGTKKNLNNSIYICEPCSVNNCDICNNSLDKCDTCSIGYSLYQNQCICPAGTTKIISNNISSCQACLMSNCDKCDKDISKCDQCQQYYFLYSDKCFQQCPTSTTIVEQQGIQTCQQCKVENCAKCDQDILKCDYCLLNYVLHQNECITACPSGFGKQILQSGIICQSCQIKYCSKCTNNSQNCETCAFPLIYKDNQCEQEIIKGSISKVSSDKYEYLIKFDKEIRNLNFILNQLVTVKLDRIQASNYSTKISSQKDNEIFIDIKLQEQPSQSFIILIKFNPNIKLDYILQDISIEIPQQKEELFTNPETKSVTEGLTQTTTQVSQVASNSLIPIALSGQFKIIATLVDISQLMNLMIYINIKHPYNLYKFLDSLQELAVPYKNVFTFIPNYDSISHQTDGKFHKENLDAFFTKNSGESITMLLTLLLIHLFFFVIYKLLKPKSLIKQKLEILNKKIEPIGLYTEIFWTIYLQVCFSLFLQFKYYAFNSDYVPEEILNLVLLIIGLVIMVLPLTVVYSLKKQINEFATKFFTEEFYINYYQLFLYLRKFVMSFVVVVFYDFTYLTISLLSLFHISHIILAIKKKPYHKKLFNYRDIAQSFLFFISTFTMYFLTNEELLNETEKLNISWIVIFPLCLILIGELIFIIVSVIVIFVNLMKKLSNKISERKKNKVHPFQETIQKNKQIDSKSILSREEEGDNQKINKDIGSLEIDEVTQKIGSNMQLNIPTINLKYKKRVSNLSIFQDQNKTDYDSPTIATPSKVMISSRNKLIKFQSKNTNKIKSSERLSPKFRESFNAISGLGSQKQIVQQIDDIEMVTMNGITSRQVNTEKHIQLEDKDSQLSHFRSKKQVRKRNFQNHNSLDAQIISQFKIQSQNQLIEINDFKSSSNSYNKFNSKQEDIE